MPKTPKKKASKPQKKIAVKKEQKEQSLENILFACRNTLRGSGGIDKKRDAILGLVFLKFAGDKFEKQREKIINERRKKKPENAGRCV